MTVAADYLGSIRFIPQLDSAVSDDAEQIRRIEAENVASDSNLSYSQLRSDLIEELLKAFLEASELNWDGYGAYPAQQGAIFYAIQFLQAITPSHPAPDISIDPDGEVAFEWHKAPRKVFSVHVGRDGTLSYAGLDGHAVFHGVEILRESIPETINKGIQRVTRSSQGHMSSN